LIRKPRKQLVTGELIAVGFSPPKVCKKPPRFYAYSSSRKPLGRNFAANSADDSSVVAGSLMRHEEAVSGASLRSPEKKGSRRKD
jgi:hypothetical protein